MNTFRNKVVVVTGGSHGIGRNTAIEFAKEGAQVSIADIDIVQGENVVNEIKDIGAKGLFIEADVSKIENCQKVVNNTVDAFGSIDILFNNVGIQSPGSYLNVEDTPEEMWDIIMNVNLKSYYMMSKFAIPHIRERGGGVIINTASVQGLQSQNLVPAYAASKGGVLSLTRNMALDYAKDNIRVLAVCPGAIDTKMVRTAAALEGDDTDQIIANWGKTHPVGRIGTGTDIANVVLFLASEKASFMTGEYVNIDGGYMALGAWAGAAGSAGAAVSLIEQAIDAIRATIDTNAIIL